MVKFVITLVLVSVLLFTLTGCGGSGQNEKVDEKKEITVTDFAGRKEHGLRLWTDVQPGTGP